MGHQFDQEIVLEFLTESGDLLRQFEDDLALLLGAPRDTELLNRAFRAMHTIKANASFLAFGGIVTLAHAAESALYAIRSGRALVDQQLTDLLLSVVDALRTQLRQFDRGNAMDRPDAALLAALTAACQRPRPAATSAPVSPGAKASPAIAPDVTRPLVLGDGKAELLGFLITDLDETLANLRGCLACFASLTDEAGLSSPIAASTAAELSVYGASLERIAEFFDFALLGRLARLLTRIGQRTPALTPAIHGQICPRLHVVASAMEHLCEGLKHSEVRAIPMGRLADRIEACLSGAPIDAASRLSPDADAATAALFDGVALPAEALHSPAREPTPESFEDDGAAEAIKAADAALHEPNPRLITHPSENTSSATLTTLTTSTTLITSVSTPATNPPPASTEPTIRVELRRLETMMDLVGELLAQKHRIGEIVSRLASHVAINASFRRDLNATSSAVDRATRELRTELIGARVQSLVRLFARFPRLVRDLATRTGKQIRLVIEGGSIEADKRVIEALVDPLMHLIRNACDHGLETVADRTAAGKDPTGTITLRASKQTRSLHVTVEDDGRGLSRTLIGAKAVERGLAKPETLLAMTDGEVFRFIFEPGFSTADRVSDLSGRGVGMDVVRANVEKLCGNIELSSMQGARAIVTIVVPLAPGLLPVLLVAVADEVYAVPLDHVVEVVRPTPQRLSLIGGSRVMRVRDELLPLISASHALGDGHARAIERYVIVLRAGDRRVGLLVTKVIGQQHVTVKPLEGASPVRGLSSVALREDGGVGLLIDMEWLAADADQRRDRVAA